VRRRISRHDGRRNDHNADQHQLDIDRPPQPLADEVIEAEGLRTA